MARFDGFVIFAEMRTGSNYLEESLNMFPGLQCHGEAFNPVFVGQHDWHDLFGMDLSTRDADPLELLRRILEQSAGLGGFRFFHDHDPRVLDAVLPNPRIAKVLLSRNPVDAYVSRKIAAKTGQWRLTDTHHRKVAKIVFDAEEFETILHRQREFRNRIRKALQTTGQTAFELDYVETRELDVLNGLGAFLGETKTIAAPSNRLKRQNPAPLSDKVENFAEMQRTLADLDPLGLSAASATEPVHDAAVSRYIAATTTPLLYMPIKGGPEAEIANWLAALDDVDATALNANFTQKSLRQWKNRNKASRSFTIVSHPVARAYSTFRDHILETGPNCFAAIRNHLGEDAGLPLPSGSPDANYSDHDRHRAFVGYLEFVRRNLSGRTAMRSDPAFSTQSSLIQGMSEVLPPDLIIRADQLELGLAQICQQVGRRKMPMPPDTQRPTSADLVSIYDGEVEAAARSAYNRDYMAFGFRAWSAG